MGDCTDVHIFFVAPFYIFADIIFMNAKILYPLMTLQYYLCRTDRKTTQQDCGD